MQLTDANPLKIKDDWVWNWRANVREGVRRLTVDKPAEVQSNFDAEASKLEARRIELGLASIHVTPISNEMWARSIIRKYNGGAEYKLKREADSDNIAVTVTGRHGTAEWVEDFGGNDYVRKVLKQPYP